MRKCYVILRINENGNKNVFGVFTSLKKAQEAIVINKIADTRFHYELTTEVLK